MAPLKLIPEEKAKMSFSAPGSVYSNLSPGKYPVTLNRRKPLHPLVNVSNMTASPSSSLNGKSERRNIAGRVLSAKEHRLKQLQNQLTDAQYHLNELYRENRLLKSIQKRQDSALQRYENSNGDIPKLINSHNEELRSLQVRYKQVKLQLRETSQRVKDKDCELFRLTEEHKKLLGLSKDTNLGEREALRNQVRELTEKVQKQNETISSLQRRLMLEEKAHKRQLQLEVTKHKETQQQLANALSHSNQIASVTEMKEKFISGKLFPKINNTNAKSNVNETRHRGNVSERILSTYSPKDNISSDISLDSNLKFSSSSTFSVVGKSLQQGADDSNLSSDNNDLQTAIIKNITSSESRNRKTNDPHFHPDKDREEGLDIHVSESDTDPPRSSDDDIRDRVESMKRQIRKSHRAEADVSFEDVRSMIELENKRISRGNLSVTSDDSSNGQLTIEQIDKVLLKETGLKDDSKLKSLIMDLGCSEYDNFINMNNETRKDESSNEDSVKQSVSRTNSNVSSMHGYSNSTRRSSNDYDSDKVLDSNFLIKKSLELNNNVPTNREAKPDLDNEKKKKLLEALKAIDRGEDQGLLFSTSKRNSLSSRKSNQ